MKYCSSCLMPDTRPRISFNEEGKCNACSWVGEKREIIDWESRQKELMALLEKYQKRNPNRFDCIVPVSGGKDSCYVAHKVKEAGFHALAVTLHPPLAFDVGARNLEHYIEKGSDHIRISPNYEVGKKIARQRFVELGQPLMAWIISVQTTIFRVAVLFDIPLVMFGEEGEVEYGGSDKLKHNATYGVEDSINYYLSGYDPKELVNEGLADKDIYWWKYPEIMECRALDPAVAHWSYFENWDSYHNYIVAKDVFSLEERETRSIGTYTNFAQTDTKLYDLHCYLMYLKFGFGRCTQDVGIDIRRGALTRKQGLALVKKYDGECPEEYMEDYFNYFDMTRDEFDGVLDKFANANLFEKVNGRWAPTFCPD